MSLRIASLISLICNAPCVVTIVEMCSGSPVLGVCGAHIQNASQQW